MHVKRQTISKLWKIPKKGTKYLIVPSHNKNEGLPLLMILRDILKIAKNRKEARSILLQGLVSVNRKVRKRENFSVLPFEIISINGKNYEVIFSDKGKLEVQETKRDEMPLKVIDKKMLKHKKIQLNLIYGKTILSNEKVKTGDSVVIKENKIVKVIPMEEGKEIIIFSGKYKGISGKLEKLEGEIAKINAGKEKINVPIKNIMVVK